MYTNIKKLKATLMLLIVLLTISFPPARQEAQAASQYIKAEEFIQSLVTKLKLSVDTTQADPYINAALTAGILKDGDFTDYNAYLTRTDAAVLINQADEYLNKDTVDEKLLDFVMNKRISDIKKVDKSKREAVAKCFAKGIIKGYFNGYYIQNRSFKGEEYITTDTAKATIYLVLHPEKRAKLSPDGELIRTTNLPKNANKYDYILACYPNKFYERKFEFVFTVQYAAGKRNPEEEIYPVDMKKSTFRTWYKSWPFSIEMDKYLYDWQEKAETYLNYVFNVSYKTVDNKWINGLASCYAKSNIDEAADIKSYYIKHMKANKVIVESSVIAVEPSALYYDGEYCMRAYIRYRITAKDINVKQNRLLYCQYPALDNLKSGVWREGIFDIRFGTNDGSNGDGSAWAMETATNFLDSYSESVK